MPLATSAASKSSILSRACPDSARAIINSALKVRIRPSDSSMVRSSAARYSASLPDFASASSARLRSRVSGVFRSWAMLSETSFRPDHQRLDPLQHGVEIFRQPIEFVAAAPDRQPPAEIAGHDALGGAGHGVDTPQHPPRDKDAAAEPEHDHDQHRPLRGLGDDAEQPPALFEIAADQQAKAAGQFGDPHQRAVIGGVLLVKPAIGGLRPARRSPSRPAPASRHCRRWPARSAWSRDRDWRRAATRGSRW